MRQINVHGFRTEMVIKYDQAVLTELEALEEARRELAAVVIREKYGYRQHLRETT